MVAMSVPAVMSLLALMRLMAARGAATLELEQAADLAQEQTLLLLNRQAPTEPLPKLLVRLPLSHCMPLQLGKTSLSPA